MLVGPLVHTGQQVREFHFLGRIDAAISRADGAIMCRMLQGIDTVVMCASLQIVPKWAFQPSPKS